MVCEVCLIYPAWHTDLPVLRQCYQTLCGKSNTPWLYLRWPGSATIVSHILHVYCCIQQSVHKRGREIGEGGRDAAVAVSWLGTFHWRSLQRPLVPVWKIRERCEEAGRGESWSLPQIAPLGAMTAVSLPMMVVCWKAWGKFYFMTFCICKRYKLIYVRRKTWCRSAQSSQRCLIRVLSLLS